jgi:glycosyltransferase involved in cell wall biosynthesis
MRIAILGSHGIPARYGGFETFAEQLAVRLVERGHMVTVFCEKAERARERYKGVELRHIPAYRLGPLSTIFYDAACLWQARFSFDVVYMLGYGSSALCWLPRLWGAQVWINMDGLEWSRAKWGPIARRYLRWAEAIAMRTPDRIIADAAAIKANLRSRYRRLPPCDVIPYGCEIVSDAHVEELRRFGLEPDSYYLVVCRFEPENHVKEIIEGFLDSDTPARLVLVGDYGRQSAYVKSLTGYKDQRLLFTGPIYDESVLQALRYFCCAYLHGHSVGGTNPSLLEAMGCGNVVIADDNPFNREVLGGSGFFFSTPEEVSACIRSVDCDGTDLMRMKAEVVERATEYYAWSRITDFYCELIALVRSNSRGRSESIHGAPVLAHEAEMDVIRSRWVEPS